MECKVLNASTIKFASAVLLLAAWGALVLFGKAPADAFINAIQYSLVGLGVYHITGASK
jgi:hypothetical protein